MGKVIKETGTPEDVPRTAAITHTAATKKSAGRRDGALLRPDLRGFPHPVAELAATAEGYRCGTPLQPSEDFKLLPVRTSTGARVSELIRPD